MRTLVLAAFALSLAPVAAFSQETAPASPSVRAMAAGYQALTVCSALKTAEAAGGVRTLESVKSHELVGVYPELDPLVGELPMRIEPRAVFVSWDETMPPRAAIYRKELGCAVMPVGWTGEVPAGSVEPAPPEVPLASGPVRGDEARLQAAITSAFEGGYGQGSRTTAVAILQNDRLVAERYAPGFSADTPQRTWSVAKSLAGTLIGWAAHRGDTDVRRPAAIADWSRPDDPRAHVTLDHLLRMASGLTSDTAGNRTDALYFGGVGVDEQATSWPLIAAPGTRYRYANNDTLLAVLAIAPTFDDHPPAELLRKLGMNHTWAETDWRGNYVLSSQVWTTARDLIRFGRLYLADGVADGERILPQGWRDYVSEPSGPQPRGAQGYGATFWLMNRSDGIPSDAFSANGNRGQYVVIVPSRGVVIVRRGEDPAGQPFDHIAFTRDLLAALD